MYLIPLQLLQTVLLLEKARVEALMSKPVKYPYNDVLFQKQHNFPTVQIFTKADFNALKILAEHCLPMKSKRG